MPSSRRQSLMKLLLNAAVALHLAGAAAVQAQSLVLPSGLAFNPDESLDLTYQVVPDYDPHEKIIAGWRGDTLRYFMGVEKLPPGFLDGEAYLQALVQTLSEPGRTIERGRSGKYKSLAGLAVHYVEIRSRVAGANQSTLQIAHHVSDGRRAFMVMVGAVGDTPAEEVFNQTRQLLQTAELASVPPPAYVGDWVSSERAPDGRPVFATLTVKDDMSFSTEVSIDGKRFFRGAGFWSATGKLFTWTYQTSDPVMAPELREDEDEIVSVDDKRWVLRSKQSGKVHTFTRR